MGEQRHTWIVDGIEEGVARVEEDGERILHVPVWLLPAGAGEGTVLRVRAGGDADGEARRAVVERDVEATEATLRRSREQAENAPQQDDPGGPIRL